jgi:hypothetical protein
LASQRKQWDARELAWRVKQARLRLLGPEHADTIASEKLYERLTQKK